jgi:hypothetical protein
MNRRLDVEAVGALLVRLIERENIPVTIEERGGPSVVILPVTVGARDGLLPVLLVVGEAVWREASGQRFGLEIERDPQALLGFRVDGAGEVPMTVAMLSILDAIERARGPEPTLRINELVSVARDALANAQAMLPPPPAPVSGRRLRMR